jgi:hypothetical protein
MEQDHDRSRRWLLGLLSANVSLVAVSFVPVVETGAVYFRLAGFVATLGALALAVLMLPTAAVSTRQRRLRTGIKLAAVFVASALVIAGTVAATNEDEPIPDTFVVEPPNTVTALPVSHWTFSPSEEELESAITRAGDVLDGFADIGGRERTRLLEAAEASNYQPRSGLSLDWGAATTQSHRGTRLATVPLLGTDIPEVSKVVFMHASGRTSVVEMAAHVIDAGAFHLDVWQDGSQIKNVDVTNPAVAEGSGVIQVFSWSVLNRCLASAGIAWWVIAAIGVVCTAVCVGTAGFGCAVCIAALSGANLGLIAACVKRAAQA